MTTFSQSTRQFRLTTPLGADVLLCVRWSCTEAVSSLFDLRIVAASEKRDIAPKDLLLKTVSLHVKPKDGAERWFTGIVRHVERSLGSEGPLVEYVLHVVPPAWLLTQGSGYAVYQDKDWVAILRDTVGSIAMDWQLQGSVAPVPSRTRYQESRWNFAARLLEREGAWFTFRHTASACTMLVANSSASAVVQNGVTELRDTSWVGNAQLLSATTSQQPFIKKTVVGSSQAELFKRDNREDATAPKFPSAPGGWALDPGTFPATFEHQLYEFIAGQGRDGATKSGGETPAELGKLVEDLRKQAALRSQADTASSSRLRGESGSTGLMPGAKLGIHSDAEPALDGQYFITSVVHYGDNGGYIAGDRSPASYSNHFTAIPFDVVYRPPRWAHWPSVQGMHVATVIGPAGEEIFTDKLGRIRVAFEWDRDASTPNGPGDACWVRVAQMVAGPGWGTFFLPRVGHQVLVSFLGGDPDAPVVVGSFYNNVNMPQIKLPDDKTQSAMRTRSSPQGSAETYNELRFEDKKGAEEVTFQAERDFKGLIKHDSTLTVKEGNQTITLEQGDQSLTISKGKYTMTVKGDVTSEVQSGNWLTTVKAGDSTTKVSAGKSALEAAKDITIESKGGKVTITSPMQIELKVGGSSIKLTPAGVEIAGTMFKASGQVTAEVSGGAMLTLKGGVVMIN